MTSILSVRPENRRPPPPVPAVDPTVGPWSFLTGTSVGPNQYSNPFVPRS